MKQVSRKVSSEMRLSVVLPVYNEAAILRELYYSILNITKQLNIQYEIVFVNDGSSDNSGEIIDAIAREDKQVIAIHLSRNFGHQPALHAGLEYSTGDIIVVMDSDMQDNPQAIMAFIEEWERGYDVVYAIRSKRNENFIMRFFFNAFYRLLNLISDTKLPLDAGNFGLIDRSVCNQILSLQEYDRYYPGIRGWVGFKQKGVEVKREARYDRRSRVGFIGLFKLAKTAIISFSSFPLKVFTFIGIFSMIVFAGLSSFVLYHKLVTGLAIPGWTSYLLSVSFFGAINALGIGILGSYIIRIYNQVRQRPLYLVKRCVNNPKEDGQRR